MIFPGQPITGEAVAAHYDQLDRFYRDVWGDHVHHGLWSKGTESRDEAVRNLAFVVAQTACIASGDRVCDIGCGYGATARLLVSKYGARVSAITISPAQHAFAQRHGMGAQADNLEFVLGDWLKNGFPSQSFDTAIAIESSEHMPGLAAFFGQAFRVIRPGGRLVVTAWLSRDAPTVLQKKWLLRPICRDGRMPIMGTAKEYARIAAEAGFAIEQIEDLSSRVSQTWREISRMFLWKLIREPKYVRFLFGDHAGNRTFALTILRLRLAYWSGAMRYAIFSFRKPVLKS